MKIKKDIKELKTAVQLAKEIGYDNDDQKTIAAYKFLYDLIYTLEDSRRRKKMTQQNLSKKSGVPRPEISKILGGEVKRVSVERLFKIASALDMKLELKHI